MAALLLGTKVRKQPPGDRLNEPLILSSHACFGRVPPIVFPHSIHRCSLVSGDGEDKHVVLISTAGATCSVPD
jgi:hypothetical protein